MSQHPVQYRPPASLGPAAPDPHRGLRGAWRAFGAPARASLTILTRPRLWPLAITPTLLLVVVTAALSAGAFAAYDAIGRRVHAGVGAGWLGAVGETTARVLVGLVLALAVVLLALVVVPPLASPFMDALAGRVDARTPPAESLAAQLARSVRVALVGLAFVAIPQAVLWLLSLLVSWLAPVWLALGVLVAALGLAYEAFDWPLARRGLGVRARLAWMRDHRALTLGLGLAAWVMALVPGLLIVMLPAMVVAAVRLVNEVEARR